MKLNANTNRGSKKDFYDLAELPGTYSLTEMFGFFSGKYDPGVNATILKH